MAGALTRVTDDTFAERVLKSEKTVLVDFWAAWCAPCRAVAPVLEALAADYGDTLEIVQLNVDDNPRTAETYAVTAIPTLDVFQRGRLVKTVIGARPRAALESELAEFLR
ncbi:thioredoxin [Streptomyces sp. NPDC101225]|uniref:thioredoxin n=1 Tax=Streptomyces sp. NPDC101225 TaxID=3366135 RepID=UPI003810CF81